jgi:hypothetical protein
MPKVDWDLHEDRGRLVVTRYEPPVTLGLLDRWFRVPDFMFDRLEWWFPRTSAVTQVPCLLYSRWLPELIGWRDFTEFEVVRSGAEDSPRAGAT